MAIRVEQQQVHPLELPTARITADEFEDFIARPEVQDHYHFELHDGEIVEKTMPNEEHGIIALYMGTRITIYLEANPIGRAGVDIRHRADARNVFLPDISVMLDIERPVIRKGAVPHLPDLAIEIKSPDDTLRATRAKIQYYLANGTRLAWLVNPDRKMVEIYSPTVEDVAGIEDTLSGGDVLPGLSIPVARIFQF